MAEAQRLNWKVLLTVTSPAPEVGDRRATGDLDHPPGRQAVRGIHDRRRPPLWLDGVGCGRSGTSPTTRASCMPQWNSNGTPASPRIYRGLWQAGYQGLKARGDRVSEGAARRNGADRLGRVSSARREGPCTTSRRSRSCAKRCAWTPTTARRPRAAALPAYAYAHHAYTLPGRPGAYYRPPERDNVTIGVALATVARAGPGGSRARDPRASADVPDRVRRSEQAQPVLGVPRVTAGRIRREAEHIAWSNPRVAAFSQYLLTDDPLGGNARLERHGGIVGFQTGLEYVSGSPSRSTTAGRVPLVVVQAGHGFSLWGLVRPATGATHGDVLVRDKRLAALSHAEDRLDHAERLLDLHSSTPGSQLARALGAARQARDVRRVRRSARS